MFDCVHNTQMLPYMLLSIHLEVVNSGISLTFVTKVFS